MVGEDVRVGCCFNRALLPPSLITRKKDENKDSEEEDDSQCMEGKQFGLDLWGRNCPEDCWRWS